MKRIFFVVLVLFTSLLVFTGCTPKTYDIALVTDVGNIDDKSFNEGAWNGVKEFAKENGISYNYFQPSEDTTTARVDMIKTAISKGAKIVVCPGFLFETAIYEVQALYPDVAFLLLDGVPHTEDYSVFETKPNVHCILYQEEQAGYLAGYAAVKEGYRKLGFLGGMDVDPVIRFGFGYVLGAEAAAQELGLAKGEVTMKYEYSGTFSPSEELKIKMDGWYAGGTEVVFSCGGGIYLSVTKAASEAGKKVIGVDVDQASESATIITSAEKKLTTSVKIALKAFFDNDGAWDTTYAGKTIVLGAAEDCVGLPTASTSWRMTNFTVAEYNTVFAKLKAGTIVVNNSTTEQPTPNLVVVDWVVTEE